MKMSQDGIDLVKHFEGFEPAAYRCPAGILTIGYGHTGEDVHEGDEVTEAMAESLLSADLGDAEDAVSHYVDVDLEQCQFDALVSFAFNLGSGALRGSTLLAMLNQGRYDEAQGQFKRWNKAGGKVLAGLTKRREAEAAMFGGEAWNG